MLAAYFLLGYAPFGDDTILTGDLNGLYVNYITDMWRRVRARRLFFTASPSCAAGSTLGLFAYYMSVLRGCDVDKPRNLAKSVTVE